MKYEKNLLEKLIFIDNLSYEEIGRQYNVTGAYIKKISRKLGIVLPIRAKFPDNFKPHHAGTARKIICSYCKKEVIAQNKEQIFCNRECMGKNKTKNSFIDYMNNQTKYCTANRTIVFLKQHILEEQNECCSICSSPNVWNDKKLIFVLDHIDGNAANNLRENLRLVCPNCDSQLDTYKSKNKNSARKERYLKNYKK